MARSFVSAAVAIAAIAIASCLGRVSGQTKGTRFEGYTYASDVQGYVNITLDYCDITAALRAGNFTEAQDVYQNGKNSWNGATKRSFYRFASHVPSTPEPLYDILTIGRNASWLDDAIKEAFDSQDGQLVLGLLQVAALKYAVHEVDEAADKVAAYVTDPANLTVNIDDDKGAPHSVDEVWALWAGGRRPNCGTLSGWATSLGNELDATFLGPSYVNYYITQAVNNLLAASRAGDSVAYNGTRNALPVALRLLGIQGVMRGAYRASLAAKCGRPASDVAAAKTDITIHWTYLYPLLVSYVPGEEATAAAAWGERVDALQAALTARDINWQNVFGAVVNVLAGMGRRLHEVGQPNFYVINASWSCPAYARP